MFGFVNNALENLVIRNYGDDKWREILQQAGVDLEDHHFLQSFLYEDYDTFSLLDAACQVLGRDKEALMEEFGDQFFHWCEESGYDQLLRLLGRSLGEFLASLDALHDHLQLTYPGMQAPSFRIDRHPTNPHGLYLHYYSVRVGLEHIVRGIILTVAHSIYHLEVTMDIVEASQVSQARYHACFSIVPIDPKKGSLYTGALRELLSTDEQKNENGNLPLEAALASGHLLTKEAFCQLFPFHIVFDRALNIVQMGESVRRLLPDAARRAKKVHLPTIVMLERPCLNLSFETILRHIHTVFVLKMRHSSKGCMPVKFKGQMKYIPAIDVMIYVCSPRVRRLRELEEHGLYLSDIPMHDATREIVMTSESQQAHLTMVQKLEETTDELMYSKNALTVEKARSDALLHSILPRTVAKQILNRQEVEPVWYKQVTILFSDIVGFTSICGECSPIDVVGMLNELYTLFDYLTTVNDVYKVETIGDAYMVVGGLPETCDDHASRIANMAMDMMHATSKVKRPDNPKESIHIRIGFHSGEVMAGVVGKKTPRYCLFGDCVNIASRTESNGEKGRINLSNYAYNYLDSDQYQLEERGNVQFKGRTDKMHCWFLNGHNTRPPTDVSLEQARRISTLLDTMAEDQELRHLPLSPLNSVSNTPKTSSGEDPRMTMNGVTDGAAAALSTGAPPRRKRSSVKPPSLEALSSAGHHMEEGAPDLPPPDNARPNGQCIFSQLPPSAVSRTMNYHRRSMSVTDDKPLLPASTTSSHGSLESQPPVSAPPITQRNVPPPLFEAPVSKSESVASQAVPLSHSSGPSHDDSFLKWYALGSTAVCFALLASHIVLLHSR